MNADLGFRVYSPRDPSLRLKGGSAQDDAVVINRDLLL